MITRERLFRVIGPVCIGMALLMVGCSREEQPKPSRMVVDPPSVYMKDKDFRAKLDAKGVERKQILVEREKMFEEMERRVDAMRAKMPGADDASVKRELEKDPEWNALMEKIKEANAKFEGNRKEAMKLVSERLQPHPVESK